MLNDAQRALFHGLYGIVGPVIAESGATAAERVSESALWGGIVLAAGAKVVQLRDKVSDGRVLLESAKRLRDLTRESGALFIVNDRLDIALMAEADGVHVGQEDLPLAEVRRVAAKLGRQDLIVGLSTHDLGQVQSAKSIGADYIGFGPIFTTATKRDALPSRGVGLLKEAVTLAGPELPVVAIGGITLENLDSVVAAGAPMAAVIRDIVSGGGPLMRAATIHRAFRS